MAWGIALKMIVKSQFFWRSYLWFAFLILVSTFLLAGLLANDVRRNEVQAIENSLRDQAELLSLSVVESLVILEHEAIRETVESFSDVSGSRFTVIGQAGVVLADSHEMPMKMKNHLSRPEIQDALLNGEGHARRYSETLERDLRYFALPVYVGNKLQGFVRTARSSSYINQTVQAEQLRVYKYVSGIILGCLLMGFYLFARQAQVVERMAEAAKVISEGNFDRRVSDDNALGLGSLARAINLLARNSADRVSLITADRNRLATIFAGMVEGVLDVDQNQKIIHINAKAAKLLGLSELNCIGKSVWQEIRNSEIVEALDKAINTRSVINTQSKISQNARELLVNVYVASLSDDAGESIGAVVVLHDVTELKNLERVRTDFVANASHELKTPITAIRGLSETVLEDEDIDKETTFHFMNRIHAQSIRLSQLVGDLLAISRLESAHGDEGFSLVDMGGLVNRSLKVAEASIEEKAQVLHSTLPDNKVEVFGDQQNLSQLVDNLIDNAIKYTPEHGEIKVALFAKREELVFEVSDTGIGIASNAQLRIFERFYRVDKARSQSLGGTGLGLSIVKNIAEKHGGSVSVESQQGSGTIFTFRMPLSLIVS